MIKFTEYSVFGCSLAGVSIPCKTIINRETDLYHVVKRTAQGCGWSYYRIENKLQSGIPDILLFRANDYWLVEAKMLRSNTLYSIEDNMKWQPGQLDFMLRALRNNAHYMLVVGHKQNIVTYCIGTHYGTENFPDFIGLPGLV